MKQGINTIHKLPREGLTYHRIEYKSGKGFSIPISPRIKTEKVKKSKTNENIIINSKRNQNMI